MSRLKRVLRMLRQALVIILITFIPAEIAFRIYARTNPTFIFQGNSYNRFRAKPHSYHYDFRMNSKGFNDVEFNVRKDEGTFRVLGIGDSFAYGMVPYQYNYLTLLEESLNKKQEKVELINMGIGGMGPKDYFSLLLKEGLELKPDMVIVSFFIGNDFTDLSAEKEDRSLYSYSYVATFIKYLIDINTKYKDEPVVANPASFETYYDDKPTFGDDYFFKLEIGRSEIFRKQSSLFDSQFDEAVGYLKRIKAVCDEHKITLAIVLIPDEVQVNKTLQANVLKIKTFTAGPDDFDFTMPNRRLSATLKEEGIRFVDLLDEFVAANQTTLYKPKDTHWNIAGNKLAAEIIQRDLFDQGASPAANLSSYEGFHEATDCNSIKGWAWDALHPDDPVKVEIYQDETLIATVTANLFREDLLDMRKGKGAHAFDYPTPAQLKDGKLHTISMKVAGTNINLINTPKQLDCNAK